MVYRRLSCALLAGTAAGVLFAGPALAQQEECARRLDQIEQQVAQAKLDTVRQTEIKEVIEGARLLGETDDQQGCMNVLAELDDLMTTLEQTGELETARGGQAGDGQTEQPPQAGAEPSPGATAMPPTAEGGDQAQTADRQPAASAGQGQGQADVTARVTIDQPQPQVLVKQKPPKITVRMPKPIVTVHLPQPEVHVQMPDPEVQVEQLDPEIQVVMGQPGLQVEGTQAQGEQGQQQVPAEVQFERDQQVQAEVEVVTEEPEVRVEQEDADVQVAQSERPRERHGQQQLADAGQQQTALEDHGQALRETEHEPQEKRAQVADENPLAAMPASDVIGTEVQNAEGDTVAEIVDLVKRQGQEDLFAVLSVGGFLGIGDKKVVVPLDELRVGQEGEIVMVNASEDQLKEMPAYEEEGYEKVSQLN